MIGIPWVKPAGVASARATAGRGERWDSSWPTVLLFRSGGEGVAVAGKFFEGFRDGFWGEIQL